MKQISIRANGTTRVATINNEPSMTQQQFAVECDINQIIEKYNKTGDISVHRIQGVYADLSNEKSYQESLQTVIDAKNAFDTLPSKIRHRFQNDPSQLLKFLEDPSSKDEAISLGLINPPPLPPIKPNEPKNEQNPLPVSKP